MNKKPPKLSIITACYNSEKTIEQTIKSIINQTYPNIEYIIIDGKSTDNTMEIVYQYKNDIDIIISEKDNGVYDAFNKGVRNAQGQYIMFINADDYLVDMEIIDRLMNFTLCQGNPISVYGDILIKNEKTGFIKRHGKKITLNHIRKGSMPPHQGIIILKSIIKEFGGFNTKFKIRADYHLLVKVFLKYESEIYYFPELITVFRLGGLSSNLENRKVLNKETKLIIDELIVNSNYQISNLTSNENYMRYWLESIIFSNKSISDYLTKLNIKKVAIFGSGDMGLLISQDMKNQGIEPICFLDNNNSRIGLEMNNIPIVDPLWLIDNSNLVDAIILGFQGNHEVEVIAQLKSIINGNNIPIVNWRDLVIKIYSDC
ncbi:glycosyltransferase [Heyndrickxia sporothermodurans]